MGDVVGQIVPLALGQLSVTADRGKWGTQFVARVRDELAHSRLAGVARGQCACDAVQHRVERRPELADLRVRTLRIHLNDPARQVHLTLVEFETGHVAGGRGDSGQRRQLATDDEDACGRRGEQGDECEVTLIFVRTVRNVG